MISGSLNGTDARVVAALHEKADRVQDSLIRKLDSLTLRLQAHIVGDKLQGQVLQHRTGKLAGSIRAIPATFDGTKVSGEVQGGGGPAFYGRAQEYGAHIPERFPVTARVLHWTGPAGESVFAMHAAAFDLPERSFMRSALADMQGSIVEELQAAASEAIK